MEVEIFHILLNRKRFVLNEIRRKQSNDFFKSGGYFSYKVIGDDAIIVHHLLNYKLKNNVVVFTKDALTKVIDILKKYSISFEIMGEAR